MPRRSLPTLFRRAAFCGFAAAAHAALGQSAGTPAATPQSDAPLQLTPFEVRTDRDVGYTASSALAGGRTDMLLKETPAAISVFTRQFLDDLAATSFHDVAEWGVNSIPEYRRNESPYGDYAVNLRGLGSSFPSRNYFLWYIDGDGYNTERLEFARGPNSVLFGDGNIGGITTTWTKRARLDRGFRSITARADTYGGYRASLDVNQPVNRNFGLRFNAVYDRAMSWRDNSDNLRDGQHLAGLWKLDERTNFSFEAEVGHRDTNTYTTNYGDAASYWDGRTVYDGRTVPTGGGLGRLGTYFLHIPAIPQAGYANWSGFFVTNGTGIAVQPRARGDIANFPALPKKEFNLQPKDSVVGLDYYTYSLYLDRRFGDNFYAQVAYNRARNIRESHLSETLFTDYRIDVNQVLPNGQPNPKFGIPFADTQRNTQNQSNLVDDLRGLVTYGVDARWLKQRVSLIGGTRRDLFDYWQKRLFRTNGTSPNYGASDNQFRERRYWDEPGAYDFASVPVVPGYTFDYAPTFLLNQRKFLDYAQLASTTKLFDDRLTVLLGLRYDHFYQTQKSSSGIPADPVTGLPRQGGVVYEPGKLPVPVVGGKTVTDVSPVSRNVGAVYFINRWLGVYGNFSQTFQPPGAGESLIDGRPPGISRSQGYDAGFKFELLNSKISGSLGYYNSEQTDRLDFRNPRTTEINRIWTNLNRGDLATVAYRDTQTYEGTGYEFDLTANPTRSLSIMFNWALPKTKAIDLRPGLRAYFDQNITAWQAGANDTANLNRTQIQADIDTIRSDLTGAVPGVTLNNTYKYTGNLYATYTFRGERLKDFSFGAGANLRGKSKIGNTLTSPFEYIYGDNNAIVSTHIAYRHRFGKVTGRFQINVYNVFQEDQLIFTGTQDYRAGGLGTNPLVRVPSLYRYLDPRKFTFSATFDF